MLKKTFAVRFVATCIAGLFVAFAGGVEWGTTAAGLLATSTFIAGCIIGTF